MTPERWQEIKGVLNDALELNPGERAAFLDRACANDASLRQEVEVLLASDQAVGAAFLNEPQDFKLSFESATDSTSSAKLLEPSGTWIGQRVGPYKIVQQIGIGGTINGESGRISGGIYRWAKSLLKGVAG
jgi:hypothetical protein